MADRARRESAFSSSRAPGIGLPPWEWRVRQGTRAPEAGRIAERCPTGIAPLPCGSGPETSGDLAAGSEGAQVDGVTAGEFRAALERLLEEAATSGRDRIEVRAGDLHRAVGGYPGP